MNPARNPNRRAAATRTPYPSAKPPMIDAGNQIEPPQSSQ